MSTFSTKKILYGSASLIPEIAVQIKDAFVRDYLADGSILAPDK